MLSTEEIFAFSLIKGIGNKSLLNLINSKKEAWEIVDSKESILKNFIKGKGAYDAITEIQEKFDEYLEQSEYELEKLIQNNLTILSYSDSAYPQLYSKIPNPPSLIFCKGNTNLLAHEKNIAIIGTRECSTIGEQVAKKTAMYFSEKEYTIVSGLALGIDRAGHEGALEANGSTIALLTDLDKIYPKENRGLAEKIIENDGLLISENKPGSKIGRGAFVSRDRLQSGLSLGIFPIETDIKGGTMHTVSFAKKQNRLIFCPDLKKLTNHYKQQYPNFNKIKGIEFLLDNGDAKAYSDTNYDDIIKLLEAKRDSLFNKKTLNLDL